VLIDFLRGRPAVGRVIGLRTSGDVPATTAINVEEIVRGLRTDETEAARRLFSGLIILPIDSRAAWQAGMWRRTFAGRGMTVYQSDCLVAATTGTRRHPGDWQPEGLPYERTDGRVLARWPVRPTSSVRAIGTPGR